MLYDKVMIRSSPRLSVWSQPSSYLTSLQHRDIRLMHTSYVQDFLFVSDFAYDRRKMGVCENEKCRQRNFTRPQDLWLVGEGLGPAHLQRAVLSYV